MSTQKCLTEIKEILEYAISKKRRYGIPIAPEDLVYGITKYCILPDDVPIGLKKDALKAEELLLRFDFDFDELYSGNFGILDCSYVLKLCKKPTIKEGEAFLNFLRGILRRWSYE